jgi:O-antigen ligase
MSKGKFRPGVAHRIRDGIGPKIRRTTGGTWRVGVTLLTLLVAQSIFWAPAAGPVLKGLVLCVGLVSYVSPMAGLLTVATLTPLGVVLTTHLFEAYPTRTSEALVLACLAGFALRRTLRRQTAPESRSGFETWSVAFVAVMVCSCFALMATHQLWQDDIAPFLTSLLRFLAFGYHDVPGDLRPWERPVGFEYVALTILLASGVALARSAAWQCRIDPGFSRRLAAGLVIGSAAVAFLNFVPDVSGHAFTIASLFSQERWSAMTGKLGSAGSFFLLTGGIAVGGAAGRMRWVWLAAALLIGMALWVTGTRAPLVAGALATVTVGFARLWCHGIQPGSAGISIADIKRPLHALFGRTDAVAGLQRGFILAVVAIAILLLAVPRWDFLAPRIANALQFRWLMSLTALRMMAEEPLFGLGVGQFFLLSERFSSEEMLQMSRTTLSAGRTNAHNYYLQIGAELGLVGLIPFLMMIGSALRPATTTLWKVASDRLLLWTLIGVSGFLITCAAGQPLILAISAYPFWLALGLLASLGNRAADTAVDSPMPMQATRYYRSPAGRAVAATAVLLVIVLAGNRVRNDRHAIDMTRVDYGLYDWETDAAGTPFRWTSDSATVFLNGNSVSASVPLRAVPGLVGPATVQLFVNGMSVDRIELTGGDWHTARVPLSPPQRLHRIDVAIEPVWRPMDFLPDSTDLRSLGIMLGEVVMEPFAESS